MPTYDFDDDLSPTPVTDVQSISFHTGFVSGDQYQIDVEGVLSKNITYAGDATADEQNSTIFNMQRNLQDMPVYGETGVTVTRTGTRTYSISVSGESAKDFELYSIPY